MEGIPSEAVFGIAELTPYLIAGFGIILVLGVVGIVRSNFAKQKGPPNRGTAPGQGATILHASMRTSAGNGSSRTWSVTKDPNEYAKGMMPGRRK